LSSIKRNLFRVWNLIPFSLRNSLDIVRRYPYWKEKGIIFIHVPKAAGVSIHLAIYGKTLGHFEAIQIKRIFPGFFKKTFSFGVVRHPVSRLISAYLFAKSGGTNLMKIKNPRLYQRNEFESFDRFVQEWLQNQNLDQVDGIFKPQHKFLCQGKSILVDQVIKLEGIQNNRIALNDPLNSVISIGYFNHQEGKEEIKFNSQTEEIIKELYYLDYIIFGYST
jgi:hypothetical protein